MSPHAEWIYINQHDDFPTEIGHVMAFIHRLRSLWLVPDDMRLAAFGAWPVSLCPCSSMSTNNRVWLFSAIVIPYQRVLSLLREQMSR